LCQLGPDKASEVVRFYVGESTLLCILLYDLPDACFRHSGILRTVPASGKARKDGLTINGTYRQPCGDKLVCLYTQVGISIFSIGFPADLNDIAAILLDDLLPCKSRYLTYTPSR